MCYVVYLSTDSPGNLAENDSELVRFERLGDSAREPLLKVLEYPNRWFVAWAPSACSCGFRHATSPELGFGPPEDWYPEDEDEIAATKELFGVVASLHDRRQRVDLIDAWDGTHPEQIQTMQVPVASLGPDSFRLFENYRFAFV